MLEWSVEIERDWAWKPGAYGKGIEKVLDAETRDELAGTYAGMDAAEIWKALFRTSGLFRRMAIKVAASLGYEYPHDLDRRVIIYLQAVEKLDRGTTCAGELARLLGEAYSS